MKVTIGQDLLGKVGTLSSNNKLIVTEIKKITKDYAALKIFSSNQLKEFQTDQVCCLIVEKEDDKTIHLFSVKIKSIHKFNDEMFVFAQPLTARKEINRRNGHRLSTSLYFGKTIFSQYRLFPPIDKQWKRGEVIDVSEGGIQLSGTEYFSKGQLIEVFLKSPILQEDEIILTKIVNIYANGKGYLYSLQFLNLSSKQWKYLKELIDKGINSFNKSS